MVTLKQADLVAQLLKKGYNFYTACRMAGTTEFYEVGRILGSRKKSISDEKIWKEVQEQEEKNKPVQCNKNCIACSLDCKYRIEEEK